MVYLGFLRQFSILQSESSDSLTPRDSTLIDLHICQYPVSSNSSLQRVGVESLSRNEHQEKTCRANKTDCKYQGGLDAGHVG
jgi:hypothetical protein